MALPIGGFVITVVVADDHAMVREGLRALLSSMEGYELVAPQSTGADTIREAVLLKPDLLILDIGIPDLNGIDIVRRLAEAMPSIKILDARRCTTMMSRSLAQYRPALSAMCSKGPMPTTCYELSPPWQLASDLRTWAGAARASGSQLVP